MPPIDVLKHIRIIVLSLSAPWVKGTDIVPTKRQRLCGPERPSFRPLLEVVTEICDILKQFLHIRLLQLSIRIFDKKPDNIELLLEPILKLRNIIEVKPAVFSKRDGDEDWVDWTLKMSYQRWMNRVMALLEGAVVPGYVATDYLGTNFFDYVHGELFVNPDHERGEGIFTINTKLGEEVDDLLGEDEEESLPFETVFDTVMRNVESHFGVDDDGDGDGDESLSGSGGLDETFSDNETDEIADNNIGMSHRKSATEQAEERSGPSHSPPPRDFSHIHETAIMLMQSGALVNTNPQEDSITSPPAEIDVAVVIRKYGLAHISQILARHEDLDTNEMGSMRGGMNGNSRLSTAEVKFEDLVSVYGLWRVSQNVKAHEMMRELLKSSYLCFLIRLNCLY
jgi:hypothetical protein